MKRKELFILIFMFTFLVSCKEKEKNQKDVSLGNTENQISIEDKVSDAKDSDAGKIITENGFMDFKNGDKINPKSKNLRKSIIENGEGSFSGYDLLNDKGEVIGFIFPKYDNKEIIGIIEIHSPEFKTKEGIGVGSTYQDLKKHYPKIETYGSEIESRTISSIGNLSFLLDAKFNAYEIDESKIKPTVKVTAITIRDKKD